jgi:signal transduction histidine kinase
MDAREASGTDLWLGRLEEIVRLTAPPAGAAEIAEQGLARIAAALGARLGTLVIRDVPGGPAVVVATLGEWPAEDSLAAAAAALAEGPPASARDDRLVLPLRLDPGAAGALILRGAGPAGPEAQSFARTAAQVVAAALRGARSIDAGRAQGALLARRNLELETIREITAALQEGSSEGRILQAVVDRLVEKLGLEAGWIFWGEERLGRLTLAAARGLPEAFVRSAGTGEISPCLCLDVFRSGRLQVARNTAECPRLPDLLGEDGPRAHACIPLKFDRGVLGVLNVAHRHGASFSREELEFLETIGTQACLAVDKLRTGRAEARRNAEARALASLAEAIGGSLEPERVLAAVADDIRQLLGFDRCALFLGESEDGLSLARLSGPPLEGLALGGRVDLEALGSRALPEALRERRTVVIDDAETDPRSSPALARRWNIGSAILLPLLAHGRVLGVLHASRARAAPFSEDEVALAGALAAQAAVALESARAYRETREALVRLQEAQEGMMRAERLAAVGTLASSLAHEVRNPLNSIALTLVLLTRRLARLEGGDPGLAPMVEIVRREVERLDALVGDFLSLSTLDRLQRQDSDPAGVVRQALALVVPIASAQGIEVREERGADLPPIPLDRRKVTQVLLNLLRNAVDAMPQGGVLTVAVRPEEDGAAIEVRDTGAGIAPGLDVFSFFTSTKRGGTGLGLPISRGIVEAHGGRLSYVSEPGRGTTFRVFLPVARPGRARGAEGS